MNCGILAIGTELLMGQITNTNATYISRKLNELGLDVNYHYVVGDNPDRLYKVLMNSFSDCDIIIATGGLGPTQDDLTKESIARAFNKKLVFNDDVCDDIRVFFSKLDREMTENNMRQAYFPEGSIVLQNERGTAPGFIIRDKVEGQDKILISLPGPPRENILMVDNQVIEYLSQFSNEAIVSKYLKFSGIGESHLEDELKDLISTQSNPTLATYAGSGDMCLRITAKAPTNEECEDIIFPVMTEILDRLGKYIYSTEDEVLEEALTKLLLSKGLKVSLAESCTGGLIASRITSIPGASGVLNRSLVTYTNEAKMDELGVSKDTLDKYTAVSEEVALEMVRGLKLKTQSDICLSITGIAGPTGGTKEKPVGLVYIGIKTNATEKVKKIRLLGERNNIRNRAAIIALNILRLEALDFVGPKIYFA